MTTTIAIDWDSVARPIKFVGRFPFGRDATAPRSFATATKGGAK